VYWLRGGYRQQREAPSFLDLETLFLAHACILGQNGKREKIGPPFSLIFAPNQWKIIISPIFIILNPS